MFKPNQSKAVAILSVVALLAGFAQHALGGAAEPQHSVGYEELDCGTADASYLAAPSA